MKGTQPARVRFGAFELDLKAGELRLAAEPEGESRIVLPDQPFRLLVMLVEREGTIVTREEIQKKFWPNDTIVEFDHSINVAIGKLRKALGDSGDQPKYIETIPRRGYRLMVPVEWVGPDDSPGEVIEAGGGAAVRMEPEAASLIGKKVSHYRVLEVIGGGGMGLVYKAEDLKLGRRVALKFLPEELASDAVALQRFEREAQTASSLNHPNICTIYEIEEHENQPFLVMELLEGETLRDRLASSEAKAVPLDRLLDIARQICDGLQAAHERGIIHRDIKPANIFLTDKGVCKILDFGLAKLVAAGEKEQAAAAAQVQADGRDGDDGRADLQVRVQQSLTMRPLGPEVVPSIPHEVPSEAKASDSITSLDAGLKARSTLHPTPPAEATLTRAGLAMGTASYMSPEQIRGEKLDARTDIFSFGLVLYEMATGQRAFSGETAAVVQNAILNDAPVPARELNSTLPSKFVATIDKALEKNRERRYQSAAEVRDDLEQVKRGTPQPAVRRRGAWYVTAVLLVAVVSFGWLYRRSHPAIKLTSKDTLVVADLINSTSDPILDDALNWPLLRAFEQSPYITLLYPSKIGETLKLLNVSEDAKLTPDLAQKVCRRTGSRAFITASVEDAGNYYQIELRAADCHSGRILAKAEAQADDRNHIVRMLGVAVQQLRGELGESADSLQRFNTPLDEHFSASLEALQAFRKGILARHEKGDASALPFFKRAVELDPQFALADLNLGSVSAGLGDKESTVKYVTAAFNLRERLSLRARFLVEAGYFDTVTGELERAKQTYLKWIEAYPAELYAHQNFAVSLIWLGQHERAAVEYRESVRLVPSVKNYAGLAESFINLNRLDEAAAVLDEAKARGIDGFDLRQMRYLLALVQHDTAGMQEQVSWLIAKPEAKDWALQQPGDTAVYQGRFRAAPGFYATMRSYRPNSSAEVERHILLYTALGDVETGNPLRARRAAERGLAAAPQSAMRRVAALVFARAGAVDEAEKLVKFINQESPLDTLIQNYELPAIRAAIELDKNRPEQAIGVLKSALPYDLAGRSFGENEGILYPAYLRGLAYLKLGQGREAAGEFQKILDHPGIPQDFITLPLSYLQLARAQAMMGDKAAARKSYQDFLTLWKDADPDIPIYQQAKAEFAKLQPTN